MLKVSLASRFRRFALTAGGRSSRTMNMLPLRDGTSLHNGGDIERPDLEAEVRVLSLALDIGEGPQVWCQDVSFDKV